MRRLSANLVVILGLVSLVAQPVEASRIFKPDQTTFLKGVTPNTSSSGCTWPSSGILADFDPSVTSTLKQNIAGSTAVTTDGDVVGYWSDNANSFLVKTGADDSTRPAWHTSGGLSWVTFDGSDDILFNDTTALGAYSAGAMTAVIAVRLDATGNGNLFTEGSGTSTTGSFYGPTQTATPDFNDAQYTFKADDSSFPLNSVLAYDEAFPAGTDVVVTVVDTGSTILTYIDGTADRSATAYTRATTTLARFSIFGNRRSNSSAGRMPGRLYRMKIYNYAFNSTEIANTVVCAKATQGR